MSIEDNGGPAFPAQFWDERATGMTLRDYFAAKALQGMLSNPNFVLRISDDIGAVPQGLTVQDQYQAYCYSAYLYADEMLEARKK